ncbi:hypothetical protein K438DRAFT_1748360 [Mycena galopus ATCC 62051]|nr:hypothetical protein K438DRAFT_1748360 [Mycena galopus ATCC 62051]
MWGKEKGRILLVNVNIGFGRTLNDLEQIFTGALFLQAIRELAAGSSPDGKNAANHAIVFYSFTLALNVICTREPHFDCAFDSRLKELWDVVSISLRIYTTKRRVENLAKVALIDVNTTMAILIESGMSAVYSVCLIAMIVPTALGNNVQYCLLSVMPGIIGIAFSLIIVRIGSGLSPDSSQGPVTSLRFGGQQSTARSRVSHDDHIAVHLSHGSQSNEVGCNSERIKNEEDREQV